MGITYSWGYREYMGIAHLGNTGRTYSKAFFYGASRNRCRNAGEEAKGRMDLESMRRRRKESKSEKRKKSISTKRKEVKSRKRKTTRGVGRERGLGAGRGRRSGV